MKRKEIIEDFLHNLDEYIDVRIEKLEDDDSERFYYFHTRREKDAKEALVKSLEKVLDAK